MSTLYWTKFTKNNPCPMQFVKTDCSCERARHLILLRLEKRFWWKQELVWVLVINAIQTLQYFQKEKRILWMMWIKPKSLKAFHFIIALRAPIPSLPNKPFLTCHKTKVPNLLSRKMILSWASIVTHKKVSLRLCPR